MMAKVLPILLQYCTARGTSYAGCLQSRERNKKIVGFSTWSISYTMKHVVNHEVYTQIHTYTPVPFFGIYEKKGSERSITMPEILLFNQSKKIIGNFFRKSSFCKFYSESSETYLNLFREQICNVLNLNLHDSLLRHFHANWKGRQVQNHGNNAGGIFFHWLCVGVPENVCSICIGTPSEK